jgi:glycosyltransferase involved in cell wall biosynthesis
MTELLASVVIPVRDDTRVLRLLKRLLHQTSPPGSYEVIVVENGSSSLAHVQGLGGIVRYLHLTEPNSAAARNAGLAAARGRYLLLIDADCLPEGDWIQQMTGALAAGTARIVGGWIGKYNPRTWVQRYAITIVDGQKRMNYLPALHLPYVVGANAGFHTAQLRQVGGFDEQLRSGADVDICYKLGLRGATIKLLPEAIVWHEDRATVADHFRRFRFYAIYQVLLFAKYRQVSHKRFVFDTYPFRRSAAALVCVPRGLVRLASGDPEPLSKALLQLIESAGVLAGELQGAVRFRQPYL